MIDYDNPGIFIIILLPFLLKIFFEIKKSVKNKKSINYIKIFIILMFFIYFINLLKYAVFPIYIDDVIKDEFKILGNSINIFFKNLEYIPFKNVDLFEYLLNIMLTFPLGCFYPLFIKNLNYKKIIGFALVTGLTLESVQAILVFIQGFTFRTISINDLFANALGVVLGYIFFRFSIKILIGIKNKKSKFLKLFLEYILEINKNFD